MAGDEIVADWLGDVTSSAVTSSATIQRFCGSSLRFKSLTFYNGFAATADGQTARIGKYYANSSEFNNKAVVLSAFATLSYEFVDLYEFAYRLFASPSYIRWIGINEY